MPTLKQRALAKAIVENAASGKVKTAGELLEIAGYDKTTALSSPGRTIEQVGVQQALEEYGFTEDNAKSVVGEILLNGDVDPNARLKAADMVFKVKGSYAPEKSLSVQLKHEVKETAVVDALTEEYEAKLLEQYQNESTGQINPRLDSPEQDEDGTGQSD